MNVLNSGNKTRWRDSISPFSSLTAIFSRSDDRLFKGLQLSFIYFEYINSELYQQNWELKRFIFSIILKVSIKDKSHILRYIFTRKHNHHGMIRYNPITNPTAYFYTVGFLAKVKSLLKIDKYVETFPISFQFLQ